MRRLKKVGNLGTLMSPDDRHHGCRRLCKGSESLMEFGYWIDDANENDGTDEGTYMYVPASCFSLTPLDVRSVRKI